jgi:hypothetical protein
MYGENMELFKMIANFNANQFIGFIILIIIIGSVFYELINLIMTRIKEIKINNKKG